MTEMLETLLKDGLKSKRRSINNRVKNLLSHRYAMLVDEEHGMTLDAFIEELEKELSNYRQELINLDNTERQLNEQRKP